MSGRTRSPAIALSAVVVAIALAGCRADGPSGQIDATVSDEVVSDEVASDAVASDQVASGDTESSSPMSGASPEGADIGEPDGNAITGAEAAPTDAGDPADDVATEERTDQCEAIDAEFGRREEADLIDWASIEPELIDPEAVDETSIELTLPDIDAAVAVEGERFEPARFGDSFDLEAASDRELLEAIWSCEEAGLLGDEELDEELDDELDEELDEFDDDVDDDVEP